VRALGPPQNDLLTLFPSCSQLFRSPRFARRSPLDHPLDPPVARHLIVAAGRARRQRRPPPHPAAVGPGPARGPVGRAQARPVVNPVEREQRRPPGQDGRARQPRATGRGARARARDQGRLVQVAVDGRWRRCGLGLDAVEGQQEEGRRVGREEVPLRRVRRRRGRRRSTLSAGATRLGCSAVMCAHERERARGLSERALAQSGSEESSRLEWAASSKSSARVRARVDAG